MKMHWLDRVTSSVAPRWTLNRIKARMVADVIARHYEAASAGRRTQGWRRSSGDATAVMAGALSSLRDQARDLVRNNGYASSALDAIGDNGVGWGIVPECPDDAAMRVWEEWAGTTACDAYGREDFYGLQKLLLRTVAESGEAIARGRVRRLTDALPVPFQIQLLEPDHIDTSKDLAGTSGAARTVQGVEFDALGRRVAYWLFPEHPGALQTSLPTSQRVSAEFISHVFLGRRIGQVRAVTWFAPVILTLRDGDEMEDATLMKQKIAACLAVFTMTSDGASLPLGHASSQASPTAPMIDSLGPGAVIPLAHGQDVKVVEPPSVADYDPFTKNILRKIATGLGVTYEDLTGDYCMSPETRILRGDLRWVRADELREGDPIVAFDEDRPSGKGQRRKWRQATVTRSGLRDLPRVRIVTDRATVTVSSEHKFLCTGRGLSAKWNSRIGYGHQWIEAKDLKTGDRIAFLSEPWTDGTSHAHGYLKGIADGEGCVDKNSAHINISQKPGPVCDEIGTALREAGFAPVLRSSTGSTVSWELSGTAQCLRFLGEVRPTRLLEKAANLYDGKAMSGGHGKQGCQTHARVLSVESVGMGPVVTLATSTHTVITEGLCSHNTNLPFSAARMSRLRQQGRTEDWRWRLIVRQFCDPAWRWVMSAAVVAGRLKAMPPAPEWTAPPAPMIDPVNEGLAYQRNIRNGTQSLSEVLRERGYNPRRMLEQMQADNQMLDGLGLILDSDPRKTTQAGQLQGTAVDQTADAAASTKALEGAQRALAG